MSSRCLVSFLSYRQCYVYTHLNALVLLVLQSMTMVLFICELCKLIVSISEMAKKVRLYNNENKSKRPP